MSFLPFASRRLLCFALLAGYAIINAAPAPAVGPFFESEQPFFQSQVELVPPPKGELVGGNFVVRGIVVPLPGGLSLVFDQELLRVGAMWQVPAGQPPIKPLTMAQISYGSPKAKAGSEHPQPIGSVFLLSAMHPGVSASSGQLFVDPRPPRSFGDEGRGALPPELARFDGIEFSGERAVLHYRSGDVVIREWHEGVSGEGEGEIARHFEIGPHSEPLHIVVGAVPDREWSLSGPQAASAVAANRTVSVLTNADALTLHRVRGELVARLAPATQPQRVTILVRFHDGDAPSRFARPPGATPSLPRPLGRQRWAGTASSAVQLGVLQQNGLIFDRIATPDQNPWRRRMRPADLAFFTADRAAVLGYDGDVWFVEGFASDQMNQLTWRRFASGLHEPLAIAVVEGVVQVATKNGVIRLYDRDGNGEADWLANFNDHMIQSQTTRSFPLDMAIGPDGSTYVSQGGIVTRSGLPSGGEGTRHAGALLRIAPDGRTSETFATGAREPFVVVHPKTGVVTATDQQGNYIPSSVAYLVRRGDHFGFYEERPAKLTPPLAWIPHEQDTSSTSQVWLMGRGMGPFDGRLLHLSYGTGRMFLISPDLQAPQPQGAVIPLDLKTDLPLLHARMHPAGDAVYLAGFQIWGTRTTTPWSLGRLRRGKTPIVTAVGARSVADGVILEFAEPVVPASLKPEKVSVRAWNYKRSSAYGSGRYTLAGGAGMTPWGVAQAVASRDGRSVFIHLPKLPAVHQLEVRHDFQLSSGAAARGVVYFTIHEPNPVNLADVGFPPIDLTKATAVVTTTKEDPPSAAMGKTVAENLGCIACHSTDGTTEGKVGPTWRRLYGAKRTFVDGTSEVADELYLREKILDPQQKKMKPGQVEMPSYRGVVTETQLEALVLYIRSLRGPAPREEAGN